MIALTQITNSEILVVINVLVFKLLSSKVLFIIFRILLFVKGEYEFFVFEFSYSKLVPIDSTLNSGLGYPSYFFSNISAWFQEQQRNFKN